VFVLDLLIIWKPSDLEIDIFCKPTTTDTTINFHSNHSMENKIATYRHHITRMHSLPWTPKQKQTEWTLIQPIMQNNNFLQQLIQNLNLQIQHKKKPGSTQWNNNNKNNKWTTFTYYSPRIRKITNLFKYTNIGISFKSTNTIQQFTKPKLASNTQE